MLTRNKSKKMVANEKLKSSRGLHQAADDDDDIGELISSIQLMLGAIMLSVLGITKNN